MQYLILYLEIKLEYIIDKILKKDRMIKILERHE